MDLQQVIYSNLPHQRRNSSGGWTSFNCPCCVDNGEARDDTRMRGGVRSDGDSISYHCFNCGFTASHKSGRVINKKMLNLMRNLGINDGDIKRLQLDAIREKELADGPTLFVSKTQTTRIPSFKDCELPEGSRPLEDVLHDDVPDDKAILGAKYMIDRGIYDHVDVYWSPHVAFRNRVIIPFYQGDRIVGYSARDFSDKAEAKYMMKSPKDFLYNVDAIKRNRRYLIVTEGVIDAACIDGVGILSNDAIKACLWVCSTSPFRASININAKLAVDAPVTMFLVYSIWPGVSAIMNFRLGVEKYLYATSIVIPCSLSDFNPSVSNDKST